jgi:hypothetical protein
MRVALSPLLFQIGRPDPRKRCPALVVPRPVWIRTVVFFLSE